MPPNEANVYALWSSRLAVAELSFRGGLAFCTFNACCGPEGDQQAGTSFSASNDWELGIDSAARRAFAPSRVDRSQRLSESFLEGVEADYDQFMNKTTVPIRSNTSVTAMAENSRMYTLTQKKTERSRVNTGDFGGQDMKQHVSPKHIDGSVQTSGDGVSSTDSRSSMGENLCSMDTSMFSGHGSHMSESAPGFLRERSRVPDFGGVCEEIADRVTSSTQNVVVSETERILLDALVRVTELEQKISPPTPLYRSAILRELEEAEEMIESYSASTACGTLWNRIDPVSAKEDMNRGAGPPPGSPKSVYETQRHSPRIPFKVSDIMPFSQSSPRQTDSKRDQILHQFANADSAASDVRSELGRPTSQSSSTELRIHSSHPSSLSSRVQSSRGTNRQIDLDAIETLRPSESSDQSFFHTTNEIPDDIPPKLRPTGARPPMITYDVAKRVLQRVPRGGRATRGD